LNGLIIAVTSFIPRTPQAFERWVAVSTACASLQESNAISSLKITHAFSYQLYAPIRGVKNAFAHQNEALAGTLAQGKFQSNQSILLLCLVIGHQKYPLRIDLRPRQQCLLQVHRSLLP
jgi:hypothetical protein